MKKVANDARVGHVHPHQLRHTLATHAVNKGMHLEAVAELLGHRNLKMTQVYARISNKTLADQFAAVADKVDALYAEAEQETPSMRRLRLEHRRMLANGWCTRPKELNCHFEAICEGVGFSRPRLSSCRSCATSVTTQPVAASPCATSSTTAS